MRVLVFAGLLILISAGVKLMAQTEESNAESIRKALLYQQENYPSSQYRDVYKNFMQDYFGPGHILNDTAASAKYLRYELSTTEIFEGPDYEPTGFNGNFYRVNLKKLKDGSIPYEVFFSAFVESVKAIQPPEPEEWMRIWKEIDREIGSLKWTFNNEEEDRRELSEQFKKGNFIVHHSETYNENVNFHYRIISREKFKEFILPYLKE